MFRVGCCKEFRRSRSCARRQFLLVFIVSHLPSYMAQLNLLLLLIYRSPQTGTPTPPPHARPNRALCISALSICTPTRNPAPLPAQVLLNLATKKGCPRSTGARNCIVVYRWPGGGGDLQRGFEISVRSWGFVFKLISRPFARFGVVRLVGRGMRDAGGSRLVFTAAHPDSASKHVTPNPLLNHRDMQRGHSRKVVQRFMVYATT